MVRQKSVSALVLTRHLLWSTKLSIKRQPKKDWFFFLSDLFAQFCVGQLLSKLLPTEITDCVCVLVLVVRLNPIATDLAVDSGSGAGGSDLPDS